MKQAKKDARAQARLNGEEPADGTEEIEAEAEEPAG